MYDEKRRHIGCRRKRPRLHTLLRPRNKREHALCRNLQGRRNGLYHFRPLLYYPESNLAERRFGNLGGVESPPFLW